VLCGKRRPVQQNDNQDWLSLTIHCRTRPVEYTTGRQCTAAAAAADVTSRSVADDTVWKATGCKHGRNQQGIVVYNTTQTKRRQSNRHADARRPATTSGSKAVYRITTHRSSLLVVTVTATVFVTVWPWPFDLWVNACRATAIAYTCTKFGVETFKNSFLIVFFLYSAFWMFILYFRLLMSPVPSFCYCGVFAVLEFFLILGSLLVDNKPDIYDSSSRFPFRARTNRQTRLNALLMRRQ